MPNFALKPTVARQHDRHSEQAMAAISDLLQQLESGLMQISTFVEKRTDQETRHALRAQSAAVSDLIAQAREKAARIISNR